LANATDVRALKASAKVEVESALAAEREQTVALVFRRGQLPRVVVTDERGVAHPRAISYVDLVATLDRSCVVGQLQQEPTRLLPLPELPSGAVLVDVLEKASGNSYVVTGTIPEGEHLFALEQGGETPTYMLRLPRICYRVLWNEGSRKIGEFSLALCSPLLSGEPTADTELYAWPFSNVYRYFGNAVEGVCWYQKGSVDLTLSEVPDKLVRAFVAIPNDADRYAGDLTHNAPYGGYKSFLEAIEEGGEIPHEWLRPCDLTIRELHQQKGRTEP
jgi:hypothetical protein